jgi:hypothetical protein
MVPVGQIIKRTWSKKSQISEHNELLDIWDSGSHIYERWPTGAEIYWKVISREETETGFTELLELQPSWQMPAEVIRKEQIPLQRITPSEYKLGAWTVEQVVEVSCNKVSPVEVQRKQNGHTVSYNKSKKHSVGQARIKMFAHKEKV